MERQPCPPEMRERCRVFESEGRCYEDVHHENWPRNDYKTEIEREFRELDSEKILICRALHNAIHARKRKSDKPTRNEMLDAIQKEKRS